MFLIITLQFPKTLFIFFCFLNIIPIYSVGLTNALNGAFKFNLFV